MDHNRRFLFAFAMAILACGGSVRAGAKDLQTDVCIVGGGSGGYAAAIGAARQGAGVVLVEMRDGLGGTSVDAYVCNWEPGVAGPLAKEIYDRLAKMEDGVGVTADHNRGRKKGPFGLWLIKPGLTWQDSLQRAGLPRREWHAVVYDPAKLVRVVDDLIAETGTCRVLLNTRFTEAQTDGRRVRSIRAVGESGSVYTIRANVFIDCSGGAHLCRAVGCETMLGPEAKSRFHEPGAPAKPKKRLNAISLCYRITPSENPRRQPAPTPPVKRWPKHAHVSEVPGGDRIINPLAMVPGYDLIRHGYDKCYQRCERIAKAHWRWLQEYPEFSRFELHSLAPMLGIRESYRVVGEYVLTQHDLMAGLKKQTHPDLIAWADHAMDVHGGGGPSGELKGPYGIPYRCLIPKGRENLLVAGRCASFSQIAASSCRLSRTMIQLGRAAGVAAAMASKADKPVDKVDVEALRKKLELPF